MKRKNIKGMFFLEGEKITYGDLKLQFNYAYIDLYSNPKSTNEVKYKSKHFFGALNGQHAINIVNCTFRRFSFPFNDYTVDFEYLIRGRNTIKYLESKLTKTNFGKLKERLHLFLKSRNFISEVNADENLENFIGLTVNTRNHLAHGTFKETNLELDKIEYVNEILTNWISLIILDELGMPNDKLLSKTRIY